MTYRSQAGQALVTLLVFVAVALLISTAAISVAINTNQATTSFSQGEVARHLAEAGLENALLQLLRNPSYTGETLIMTTGTVTASVSGSTTKSITVEAIANTNLERMTVTASVSANQLDITSWTTQP